MSYNGIGLQSARGSGTSGHIQSNLATKKNSEEENLQSGHYKKRKLLEKISSKKQESKSIGGQKKYHDERQKQRDIDVQCMELRDKLEDLGEDDEVIEKKVSELRNRILHNTDEGKKADASQSETDGEQSQRIQRDEGKSVEISKPYSYVPRYKSRDDLKSQRSKG